MAVALSGPRRLLRRLRDVMAGGGAAQARLDAVVRLIAADMVAEVCSCYLLRAGQVLELFASQGLNPGAVHTTRLRVNEGLVGHIAASGRSLSLDDAQAHPMFAYRPETGEEIYHSLMGVPILRDGRVVGVLVVQNRTQRAYDDEDLEALEVVAMVLAELVAGGELVDPAELVASDEIVTGPTTIDGLGLVAGVAMGTIVVRRPHPAVTELVADDSEQEHARLAAAVAELQQGVDRLLDAPDIAASGESRDVLETYRMFARDSGWLRRISEAVTSGLTAEAAVVRVQEDTRVRMAHVADAYLRERMLDLDDLGNRLLRHLTGDFEALPSGPMPERIVLVSRDLGPAELLEYDREHMAAVILEEGSPTMHLAVVARAFDIPVIGQVRGALSSLGEGEVAIVDGGEGRVTVRPAEEHRQQLREQESQRAEREALFASIKDLPARTRDGLDVSLNINVGLAVDAEQLEAVGADGIGLCRTEVPFMVSARYPDVEAQTKLYASLIEQAGTRPVVFRTLDVGGDKRLPYLEISHEENPAMGWRALRIGLDQPAVLRQQLRALLRAANGGDLRVMFPMVATVDEFCRARDMLDHERDAAKSAGEALPQELRVGAMLEVPALLWQLPALLAEVDFLSIGTNDLVQFLFASDRGNAKISRRYGILTPAALSLMRNLVQACEEADVPLAVCGEAAGQPLEAMALIGLGVRNLSMAPRRVGPVKLMCRSLATVPLAGYLDTLYDSAKASLHDDLLAFAKDHGVDIV